MYIVGSHHWLHAVDGPLDCAPLFCFRDTRIEVLDVAKLSVELIGVSPNHARHLPKNLRGNVWAGHVVVGYVQGLHHHHHEEQ